MTKLKNPLLSLDAHGTLARALTFLRRRKQDIVEKMPAPSDPKTQAQVSWRHMYQKCAALWHTLSEAEKREWAALASTRHMTAFAYWQSQCLRPNPGIYLPLQGGTMQGDIDMAKYRLLRLPLPVDAQEPLTLAYHDASILPYLGTDSCRAYHPANQPVFHATDTYLIFQAELWDTNNLHDNVVNPDRLTARKDGYYLVSASIAFAGHAVNLRMIAIIGSPGGWLAAEYRRNNAVFDVRMTIQTIVHLQVGQYVRLLAYQSSGVILNVLRSDWYSAHFMMALIGA